MAKEMSVPKGMTKVSEDGAATVALVKGDAIAAMLAAAGLSTELVGGTLPKLEWSTPGEARLLRYESRKTDIESSDGDKTFNVVTFAELDPAEYIAAATNGDPAGKACKVKGRGFMPEGVAIGDYFEAQAVPGDILVIVYGGSEERGKQRTMNHFTVQRLYAAPRPAGV